MFVSTLGMPREQVLCALYNHALSIKQKKAKAQAAIEGRPYLEEVDTSKISSEDIMFSVFPTELSFIYNRTNLLNYGEVGLYVDLTNPDGFESDRYDDENGAGAADTALVYVRRVFEDSIRDQTTVLRKAHDELQARKAAEAQAAAEAESDQSPMRRLRKSLTGLKVDVVAPVVRFTEGLNSPRAATTSPRGSNLSPGSAVSATSSLPSFVPSRAHSGSFNAPASVQSSRDTSPVPPMDRGFSTSSLKG